MGKDKKLHILRIKKRGGLEYKQMFTFHFFICNAIHHRNPPYNIPISPHNTPKHPLQTPHTPPKTHHKLSVNSLIINLLIMKFTSLKPPYTPHTKNPSYFLTPH